VPHCNLDWSQPLGWRPLQLSLWQEGLNQPQVPQAGTLPLFFGEGIFFVPPGFEPWLVSPSTGEVTTTLYARFLVTYTPSDWHFCLSPGQWLVWHVRVPSKQQPNCYGLGFSWKVGSSATKWWHSQRQGAPVVHGEGGCGCYQVPQQFSFLGLADASSSHGCLGCCVL